MLSVRRLRDRFLPLSLDADSDAVGVSTAVSYPPSARLRFRQSTKDARNLSERLAFLLKQSSERLPKSVPVAFLVLF